MFRPSLFGGVLVVVVLAAHAAAQNSRSKIRPRPSQVAARAGSAVSWRDDLDGALAESRKTGKPVFWYVPTLRGSPMDRRPEIDRYMMAGPFSWPRLIALLNRHYIPVKSVPRGALVRELGLRPRRFIEPGYIVLGAGGKELRRLDRITTFHPEWFLRPLAELVQEPVPRRKLPAALTRAWSAMRSGRYREVGDALHLHALSDVGEAWRAEACYLCGVAALRQGRSDEALKLWQSGKDKFPETNFGWKCAAEVEGHGPLYYGFEVYRELPARVFEGPTTGSRASAGVYDEDELRRRSIGFLLGMQRSDGGYTDSRYDFGGTDSLPNVHLACTALVTLALRLELAHRSPREAGKPGKPGEAGKPGKPGEAGKSGKPGDPLLERLAGAVDRAMEFLGDEGNMNSEDRDELVWACAYRARLLARSLELAKSLESKRPQPRSDRGEGRLRRDLAQIVKRILELQPSFGQWFHEYPNPFATATVLQVLAMAKKAGVDVNGRRVARGIGALKRCRADNGGFTYGSVLRGRPRVDVRQAAGRMPLCELALWSWGESDQTKLRHAIETAFEHHQLMESVRKYDDHASHHGYGGFFYWFDMLGRTDAILAIEDEEQRKKLLRRQREIILSVPEIDGCFVDSHELGRSYGTAMALICLADIRSGL